MGFTYRFNELAHKEYIEAFEWYELSQPGLGDRFMNCVEKKLSQISDHPEYYSKKDGNFRETKVENFPYIIAFEFFKRKELIHIAAIYHSRRNPKRKYRKMK